MKLTDNLYFYPERGMLDSNTYVLTSSPGIIIDPGSPETVADKVEDMRRDGIDPAGIGLIVNTHLHGDHSWGDQTFKEVSGAKIAFHRNQKQHFSTSNDEAARFFGLEPVHFDADIVIDGDSIKLENGEVRLIPAPGHSLDSVCFYEPEKGFLACGDVLFQGNTGRVDLPGGSARDLTESIEALSNLNIEYLLPGHMDVVFGADRVRDNFEFIKANILRWM
ncbi:MAG: MBL fold metallo-hydrolase [Chloroflexi bacterium]|nr:MBL fold metallo-hydrolase [Chloroflexota bacterium]